jgi:hypothetical protein
MDLFIKLFDYLSLAASENIDQFKDLALQFADIYFL